MTLFDFTADPRPWRPVDDPVMGGVSASTFAVAAGAGVFTGTVSLDRGGGFCSARSPEFAAAVAGFTRLVVTARGDGKTYTVGLTPAGAPRGLSYRAKLTPGPAGDPVTLRLADMVPMVRGTVVPAGPLAGIMAGAAVLIADRQAGPFRLELLRLELQ